MNSGIPLEKFPLVPQGHHHHHQDHLAFAKVEILLLYLCGGVEKNKMYKNKRNSRFLHAVTTKLLI
jgi:hypothetical protein